LNQMGKFIDLKPLRVVGKAIPEGYRRVEQVMSARNQP